MPSHTPLPTPRMGECGNMSGFRLRSANQNSVPTPSNTKSRVAEPTKNARVKNGASRPSTELRSSGVRMPRLDWK